MITVLFLEDDAFKTLKITQLLERHHIPPQFIVTVNNVYDAENALLENFFDLLILDINVPLRRGEAARRHAGLTLLKDISRRKINLNIPDHIVGLERVWTQEMFVYAERR